MDTNETPSTFDPDLDLARHIQPSLSYESIAAYQRLVCNPFLGVFGMLCVYSLIRFGLERADVRMFVAGMGSLILPFYLFQYHCLDCGTTGWMYRYPRHACSSVVARCNARRSRRFRGPSVKTQTIAWFCLMGIAFLWAMSVMPFSIRRR